jgi:hypothetical protein
METKEKEIIKVDEKEGYGWVKIVSLNQGKRHPIMEYTLKLVKQGIMF